MITRKNISKSKVETVSMEEEEAVDDVESMEEIYDKSVVQDGYNDIFKSFLEKEKILPDIADDFCTITPIIKEKISPDTASVSCSTSPNLDDIPIATRLKKKSKRVKKEKVKKIDNASGQWTEEEKLGLCEGLKKYGHFDFELIHKKCVPTRSSNQIKAFFYRKLSSHTCKMRYLQSKVATTFVKEVSNNKLGIEINRGKKFYNKKLFDKGNDLIWWQCFLQQIEAKYQSKLELDDNKFYKRIYEKESIAYAMYMISRFEKHPLPSECGGVDFEQAYDFLWKSFTNQISNNDDLKLNLETKKYLLYQFNKFNLNSLNNPKQIEFLNKLKNHINEIENIKCDANKKKNITETKLYKTRSNSIEEINECDMNEDSQTEMLHETNNTQSEIDRIRKRRKRPHIDPLFKLNILLESDNYNCNNDGADDEATNMDRIVRNSVFNPLCIPESILLKKSE